MFLLSYLFNIRPTDYYTVKSK